MRNLLIIFIVMFIFACSSKPLTEDRATDIIQKLPEVQQFITFLGSQKPPVKALITAEANEGAPGDDYYMVAIAENHPTHVVTLMRFFINKNTKEILVNDVVANKNIPLDEWRKKQ